MFTQAVPPPDYNPCAQAAKAGDLELLQKLRREGHPWNTEVQQCGAWAGHLHVLQYALAQGCPWSWDVCEAAARHGGHTEVVDWAVRMRDADRCEACGNGGSMEESSGVASSGPAAAAATGTVEVKEEAAVVEVTTGRLARVATMHEGSSSPAVGGAGPDAQQQAPAAAALSLKQTDSEAWTFILREMKTVAVGRFSLYVPVPSLSW